MANFEETSIGFKAIFQKTFNAIQGSARKLATYIKSNDLSEKYSWLGNFPKMKEWIGDRDIQALTDYGYQIDNKSFEDSITVPNKHIEHDKVGLYQPAIEQMAQNSKMFPDELVADKLVNGHTNLCYDGKAFFADDHVVGVDTYDNNGIGVLNNTNLLAGEQFMLSIKNPNGDPLKIKPTIVVCGPSNLANVIDAIDKEKLANGESNPTYKRYEYMILPEITGLEWFMLDTSKPLKPFILQVVTDGKFTSSNDHKFVKDASLFGVDSFMNVGYGLWQLAYRFSGTAA